MNNNESATFRGELQVLINRYNKEAGSDTPDFILTDYLMDCLNTFDKIVQQREKWYGRNIFNPANEVLAPETCVCEQNK